MTESQSIRVLVDQSVCSNSGIGQWVKNPHTVNWGGRNVTSEVTEFVRRPTPPPDQLQRKVWIDALPTIARLGRVGHLKLVTSTELGFESWTASDPCRGTVGDLFRDVEFEQVDSPVERSFFHQTIDMKAFLARETVRDFCRMLLRIPDHEIPRLLEWMPKLTASTRRGLIDLSRFRRLCRHRVEIHYPDLFHWWTADHADCSFFLTMDRKFWNFAGRQCRDVLASKVVNPAELLEILGVEDWDPMPFREGQVLSFFDAIGEGKET